MQFTVNSEEISSASARVHASVTSVRNEVHGLMAHLHALQGSWSGVAAESFADCSRRWHLVEQQVEASLQDISAALATAARSYEEVENSSRAMFGS
ncbi:MAG: WXG100 family type VII secretion target [Bowdeniella nasicola]|nr:WXG100 family type VII secretion target [Bowdeniella nasicola]